MAKAHQNDVGTVIRLETGVDLTSATAQHIKVLEPDGTEVQWAATVEAPATAGVLTYTCTADDLDQAGTYELHAYVEFGSNLWLGELVKLKTFAKFEG